MFAFSLPQLESSVKRTERGMRLGGGSVEGREERVLMCDINNENPDGITTTQCDAQQSSFSSAFSFLCLKLIGENSYMPNIYHARLSRLSYECIAGSYDDEYGGSGSEERGCEFLLFL
jgi:hypothetical protein